MGQFTHQMPQKAGEKQPLFVRFPPPILNLSLKMETFSTVFATLILSTFFVPCLDFSRKDIEPDPKKPQKYL
jgi:hypothetical protein